MSKELGKISLNSIVLSGGVVRDIELKYIPSGTALANMSLGFGRSFKNSQGEWTDKNGYIDVSIWGKLGERCTEKLHKGSQVIVEGYIEQDSWVDKENNKRSKIKIVASRVHFLEKGQKVEVDNNGSTDDPPVDPPF